MSPLAWQLAGAGGLVLVLLVTALVVRRVRRGPRAKPATAEREPDIPGDGALEIDGDVVMTGTASFPHGLVVHGSLELTEGARVDGAVTADGDLALGRDVVVDGPVAAGHSLRLGPGARVRSATVTGEAVVAADALVEGRLRCARLVLVVDDVADERATAMAMVDEPER